MTEREAIHKLILFRRILEKGVFPVGYRFDAEPFDLAISALEKQEKDRWIPVTERLPEYEKEVLTCGDNGDISVGYLYFPGFGHADRWHVDFTSAPVFHIVAWRPLPEPYTEEEA